LRQTRLPDVRLQRQKIWRFRLEPRARIASSERPIRQLRDSGRVDAFGVGQTKFILVNADFEAAGDCDGYGPTGAGQDGRGRWVERFSRIQAASSRRPLGRGCRPNGCQPPATSAPDFVDSVMRFFFRLRHERLLRLARFTARWRDGRGDRAP